MKGIQGILLATALGIAAALFNFMYLEMKSKDVDKIYFVGIADGVTVSRGEPLSEDHLARVEIPERWVGNLGDFAIRYEDVQTVIGSPVWRTLTGETLLLSDDLKTPAPRELKLEENERAWGIPLDSRQFVPSLVVPGDLVSFLVPRLRNPRPTPAGALNPGGPDAPPAAAPAAAAGANEIIGPFRVLSLGNRLGSAEVLRAARVPQLQENVMTVAVKVDLGILEPKAQKLADLLRATNFRQVQVLLHPRPKDK